MSPTTACQHRGQEGISVKNRRDQNFSGNGDRRREKRELPTVAVDFPATTLPRPLTLHLQPVTSYQGMACSDISSCIASYSLIFDTNRLGRFRHRRPGQNPHWTSIREARLSAHGTLQLPRTRGACCQSRRERLNIEQRSGKKAEQVVYARRRRRNGREYLVNRLAHKSLPMLNRQSRAANRQTGTQRQGLTQLNHLGDDTSRRYTTRYQRSLQYTSSSPISPIRILNLQRPQPPSRLIVSQPLPTI